MSETKRGGGGGTEENKAVMLEEGEPRDIQEWAVAILNTVDAEEKARMTQRAADLW